MNAESCIHLLHNSSSVLPTIVMSMDVGKSSSLETLTKAAGIRADHRYLVDLELKHALDAHVHVLPFAVVISELPARNQPCSFSPGNTTLTQCPSHLPALGNVERPIMKGRKPGFNDLSAEYVDRASIIPYKLCTSNSMYPP